ncbi:MAG: hypothetical protein AAFX93_19890 [Verrucomicrobiota bacterium]
MYNKSRVQALATMENKFPGQNFVTYVDAADLTEETANTAQTIELADVLAGEMVTGAAYYLETPFQDASDAAFNSNQFQFGDGIDPDRFIANSQLNQNGTEVPFNTSPGGTSIGRFVYTGADTLDGVFSSMSGKSLSNLDIGKIWVIFGKTDVTDIAT